MGDAGVHQDAIQTTARAHQQGDAGGRRQAFVGELEDRLAVEALGQAQGPEAHQGRHQQGDHRVADKQQELVETAARRGNHVGPAADHHQHHRQQDGAHSQRKTGQARTRFTLDELALQRVFRWQMNVRHDELGVDGAGNDRRGDANQDRIQHRLPDRGVIGQHRHHRRRVRRHQRMHHRQAGDHRQPDHQDRHAHAPRHGKGNRHQQHKADFEKQRQPHQERNAHHRPVSIALTEAVDQRARHLLGAPGFGHHLAEHGAQRHHQGDMPQGLADTRLVRAHDGVRRHPGHQRQADGHQGNHDKGVESVACNQHDQCNDGDGSVCQQPEAR